MYTVLKVYPSHVFEGGVAVRFEDFDGQGNRHILNITNENGQLAYCLTGTAFVLAEYKNGVFTTGYKDVTEEELAQRLVAGLGYLKANKKQFASLWSVVKPLEGEIKAIERKYS